MKKQGINVAVVCSAIKLFNYCSERQINTSFQDCSRKTLCIKPMHAAKATSGTFYSALFSIERVWRLQQVKPHAIRKEL